MAVISGMSAEFGSYWETQCEGLTQVFVKNAQHGTGRVALSSFHAMALEGQSEFSESAEYLRHLGVLDESSRFHGPQVIASNYIQSANSCVIAQKHFRVCCANPCQDFYSDLEETIGAPEGAPEAILAIVSNFTYGFDDATPRISKKLRAQLEEIAQANHGSIPLHGRLFAQWLHFVFPTECPFPHKSNSVSGLSPQEFGSFLATSEEMQENARRGKAKAHADGNRSVHGEVRQLEDSPVDEFMGMWSSEEELLSQQLRLSTPSMFTSICGALRPMLYGLAAVSVLVVGVLQPALRAIETASECGCSLSKLSGGQKKMFGGWETKSHLV